ncbi:MAG: alpha-mannosidase [Kiritimatiellae bacterium]|nr:alpha-mannosidase [Kiritimatiellia bacterium]
MSHFYLDIHEKRIRELAWRLTNEIAAERVPLRAEAAVTKEPVPWADRLKLKYRPIKQGERWGGAFDCGWFHVTGEVPKAWKGAYVTLNLDFHGEALVFDAKGCPLVGLTNGCAFLPGYRKDHFHWLPKAKGGEKVDFWIDAGANDMFGVSRRPDPVAEGAAPEAVHGTWSAAVDQLSVCRFDYDKWQLKQDLDVILSLCEILPEKSSRRIQVVRATSRALDLYPPERGGARAVHEALRKSVWGVGVDPAATRVTAIGHSHIDVEWLWPLRETVRKVGRTFASQLMLMARYPEFKYGSSQAQLYELCKQNYPALYKKVKKAIADGRWEVQGGMWVEADCNVPSGESLVRQCLVGQRFFKEEFGVVPRNLWLPDVFGYSGQLPQILQQCGIGFFLTQKLSWNRYNKFPHNSFVWEGIDGSRVVAHFPPEDTYNANLMPEELGKHERNNREAGIVDVAISLFGMGDGGGGPKEEHVERGRRCAALNGCPPVTFGFAQDAMDRIAEQEADLDVWSGELYFEMHRATFTTQAAQKLANRRAEEALRVAEMLCAAAFAAAQGRKTQDANRKSKSGPATLRLATFDYPAAELLGLWKSLLLCQFHDIIPGSSIHRVYEESGALVRGVAEKAHALAAKAAATMLAKKKDALALFNPSSTPYFGVISLPPSWAGAKCACGSAQSALPSQKEGDKILVQVEVPPRSFATLLCANEDKKALAAAGTARRAKGLLVLENTRVRYEIDPKTLQVTRALDKECKREFITSAKPGNVLSLYDDHPHAFDAWDIDEYLYDMPVGAPKVESAEPFDGPVCSGLRAVFSIGASRFVQTIRLAAGSKRLDFETSTDDWKESHKILRAAFPTDVVADQARFEIQYGTVARPTHDNTKWDYAQFESCAHRYADLSEPDFGVALLNDCKYGYRVKGSELSISLLRASTEPDPVADKGAHRFTYAILPHAGDLAHTDEVVKAAAELNQGVERFEGFAAEAKPALPVALEGEGIDLAVLKKAEDSDDLVVRLVETRGRRAVATLTAAGSGGGRAPTGRAVPVLANELAETGAPMALPAKLSFRPFEIKTLRLSR